MDFPGPKRHLEDDVCADFDRILLQARELSGEAWREFDAVATARW